MHDFPFVRFGWIVAFGTLLIAMWTDSVAIEVVGSLLLIVYGAVIAADVGGVATRAADDYSGALRVSATAWRVTGAVLVLVGLLLVVLAVR